MNEGTLIARLEQLGFVTRAELLDGSLEITRTDRRNQNYRISGLGRDLFVKQGSRRGTAGTVELEATMYDRLNAPRAAQSKLARYVVPRLGYDAALDLLILQAIADSEDLGAYHQRSGRFPDRLASELGVGLGLLHAATPTLLEQGGAALPRVRPTVFALGAPDLGILREASAINLKIIRLVQAQEGLTEELERSRSEWRTEAVIHGDLKLANCLTCRTRDGRRVDGIKWIDWEFSGLGDSRWDVGSLLSDYLMLWVFSIPIPRSDQPDLMLELARFPLGRVQRVFRLFLSNYLRTRPVESADSAEWLQSVVRMAGARLIQTAYEHAAGANEISAPVITLLQLATNILKEPDRARVELFGIRDHGALIESRRS